MGKHWLFPDLEKHSPVMFPDLRLLKEGKVYVCKVCSFTSPKKFGILMHLIKKHRDLVQEKLKEYVTEMKIPEGRKSVVS